MSEQSEPGLALGSVRRQPRQERSVMTIERILDAAGRLLEQRPVESVTTIRIAAEAGLSVGALYRFFPDREAVCDALIARYSARLQAMLQEVLATSQATSGEAVVDETVERYVAFMENEPGFQALWIAGQIRPSTLMKSQELTRLAARIARRFTVDRLNLPDDRTLDLRMAVAAEAGFRVLEYAFRQTEFDRRDVIREAKRVVTQYLYH